MTDIKDEDVNVVTSAEVSVNLLDRSQLVVRDSVPAFLILDLDMKTSNAVEFDSDTGEMSTRQVAIHFNNITQR